MRIGSDGRVKTLLDSSGDGRGRPLEAPFETFAVSDAGDVFVGDGGNVFWIQPGGYVVRVLGPDTFPIDRVDDLAPGPDGTLYFLAHSGLYRLHPVPHCRDGFDDDADGLVDYPDDPGCLAADSWVEAPQCDNDLDDDGGGDVDWDGGAAGAPPDPECLDRPWRDRDSRGCGLGFTSSPAIAGLALALRRRRGPTRATS